MDIPPPTYDEMNKERIAARKKLWAQNNKEKTKIATQKWKEKNRESLAKKQYDYNHGGYYKKRLLERFEVVKAEIIIGNDSGELLEEFKELIDEMLKYELIDVDTFNNLNQFI